MAINNMREVTDTRAVIEHNEDSLPNTLRELRAKGFKRIIINQDPFNHKKFHFESLKHEKYRRLVEGE